eukprot:NODE_793_length_4199_cov_0.962195.p3 type:complete len:236 gc:universal NODE_793_length_4199_cov_0.962195:1283-576(-)
MKNIDVNKPMDYSTPMICIKRYSQPSPLELSLEENELVYVLEEKDLFYFCFSPTKQENGFVPKNYLRKQQSMVVLGGKCIKEYKREADEDMWCRVGDTVIALANIDSMYLLCKNLTSIQNSGRVLKGHLLIDGDINTLPNIDDYEGRKKQNKATTPVKTRSRSNTTSGQLFSTERLNSAITPPDKTRSRSNTASKLSLSVAKTSSEEKILEKLIRPRSNSASVRIKQLLSPPKDY